ncbi:recombination-associated protein RdgC [Candidatus Halobeggiatoa sp. HSG11]|nr:recombination-associated protein RdgC [Candidatus Halobeggiatoa sp. HSG11]
MWFKNLHIFRFLQDVAVSTEELQENLTKLAFHPCGKMDMESIGWVSPLGHNSEHLVYSVNNCLVFKMRKEEKILPASVIREFVNDRVEEIEAQQMRKVRKREKDGIRDEVLHDLIPRAFTRSNYLYAYIDVKHGWLLIDTPNSKKAEELVSFLRHTVGSLPVVPPKLRQNMANVMTQWLIQPNDCPADIELGDACVLANNDGAEANCKRQNLLAKEINAHLKAGKLVKRLALEWNDRLGLIVDDELVIRRLQILDLIKTQINDIDAESFEQQFQADFTIMNAEIGTLIERLFTIFGGEDEEVYKKML